jgi:UDP-2,3-diacylglucosamine hydrolase
MLNQINTTATQKIYFLSDFHLGSPEGEPSRLREKKIIDFINTIESDLHTLFILGDVFDFWFEYKYVVPKGFVRLQAKLAELTDKGIRVILFTGNHDLWMFGYFEKELGIEVYHSPQIFYINNHKCMIGHGDALGPGDYFYKFMKKIFVNPFFQWVFRMSPPSIGMGIAFAWSRKSRHANSDEVFHGENEYLIQYTKKVQPQLQCAYYIFGHRHLPLTIPIHDSAVYINTGDWIHFCTYAVYENNQIVLKKWEKNIL